VAILALDHVQLAIPDGGESQARSFYAGLLGMQELAKPALLEASGGVWFRAGGVELHLGVEADFRPARKAHPGVRVDDVERLAFRLGEAGHDVLWDERYPGVRRFYVHDPFGNRLEFLQPVV
jgi:catechol 2,3-dioxygenase-like lactoylglutathione lyase family enzyme